VSIVAPIGDKIESVRSLIGEQLRASGLVAPGATVVLINLYMDLSRDEANYLKIQRL